MVGTQIPHMACPPKAHNVVNIYPCNNSNNDFDYTQSLNKKYKPWNQHSMPTLFIFIKTIIIKTFKVSHNRLNSALHHYKQWCNNHLNIWLDDFLLSLIFVQCKYDPNVYFILIHDSLMIIFLYVDDLMITGSSKK